MSQGLCQYNSYILLQTKVGRRKDPGFRSRSDQIEVLAGTLLNLVETKYSVERGVGLNDYIFETLDFERRITVICGIDEFQQLTLEEEQLLRPIPTCRERLEVYMNKDWLHDGMRLIEGDPVYVKLTTERTALPGILRFKGHQVPDSKGVLFGIELKEPKGSCDGTFRRKKFFITEPDHGVFVPLQKVKKSKDGWQESTGLTEELYQQQGKVKCNLVQGERVVWMSDDGPEKGSVLWIGYLPDDHSGNITVGVSFDNPVGTGTGKYKDKRLFYAKNGHASLIPLINLIKEEEYENPGNEAEELYQQQGKVKCNLVQGERVVWMSDDGPEKGSVLWIGYLPDDHSGNITVGVSFDNPVGTGTGKYKDKRLFYAKNGHASLIPLINLIKEEEYENPGNEAEELYQQQGKVKCNLVQGERVVWMSDDGPEKGSVLWIGYLPDDHSGNITVGVSFDNPVGTGTGKYKDKRLFYAKNGHASLIPLINLIKEEEYENPGNEAEELYQQQGKVKCNLVQGERVVWMSDDGPEKGSVLWIGYLPDDHSGNITVGVSFDNPVGTGTGKYKDKRLFYAKNGHASLIPLINLIKEEEYENPGNEAEELYQQQGKVKCNLVQGERVVWMSDDGPEKGSVLWIGYLPDDHSGNITAGVSFDNPVGTGTGKYKDKRLFYAKNGHASLIPLINLIKEEEYENPGNEAEELYQQQGKVKCNLVQGERVVWMSDDGPEKGSVLWIGYLPDDHSGNITAGVSFDNPVGTGTGKYKDKRLFYAKNGHASLIPLINLIKEEEYENPGNEAEELYQQQGKVKCNLVQGERVVWMSDDGPEKGSVLWIGYLPDDHSGNITAGVSFDNPVGTGTGKYKDKRLFYAKNGHASLIPLINLIKEEEYENPGNEAEELYQQQGKVKCNLVQGERVVWMSDDGPEKGSVLWIGYLPDDHSGNITVGVSFDNPVGTGTGKYKDKRLFYAKNGHASLIPLINLIKEEEYENPGTCQGQTAATKEIMTYRKWPDSAAGNV